MAAGVAREWNVVTEAQTVLKRRLKWLLELQPKVLMVGAQGLQKWTWYTDLPSSVFVRPEIMFMGLSVVFPPEGCGLIVF